MTPENGKISFAPLRKGRELVAGSVIALLATTLVGIANPAQAAERSATKAAGSYVRTGDDGDKDKDKYKDKDKENGKKDHDGRPRPPSPPPPGPCYSIDSTIKGDDQLLAAVVNGVTSVGVRKLSPGGDDVDWVNLSTAANPDYPNGVCDSTITEKSSAPDDVLVNVITTGGEVWETTCTINHAGDDSLTCPNPWTVTINQP